MVMPVMGSRADAADGRYGAFTLEKLLDLPEVEIRIEVVAGILTRECLADQQEWEARGFAQ